MYKTMKKKMNKMKHTTKKVYPIVTQTLISNSRKLTGVNVKSSQTFYDAGDTNNIHASIDALMSLGSRIIFIAEKNVDSIVSVLTIAAQAGHINADTVWITMTHVVPQLKIAVSSLNHILQQRKEGHLAPAHFQNAVEQFAWTTEDDTDYLDFDQAFAGGVFTFVPNMDLTGYPQYDAFNQKWQNNSLM